MPKATIREEGSRIFVQTFGNKDLVAKLKELDPRPRWEGWESKEWSLPLDSRPDVEKLIEGCSSAPASEAKVMEDPDRITLVGKGTYKGKNYFIRRIFAEDTPPKAWLISFDGKICFKAQLELVTITKRYETRESRSGRAEYMTLGKIQRFVEDQKADRPRRVRCGECGSWHNSDETCRDCGGC